MSTRPRITPAELLFAVSLISLLLLGVSVRLLDTRTPVASADLLEQVHVLLQLARVEAVDRGAPCRVEIDRASGESRIVASDSGSLLHRTVLNRPENIQLADADGVPSSAATLSVDFEPTGRPAGGAAGILVRSAAAHGAVWVDPDGDLLVEDFRPLTR